MFGTRKKQDAAQADSDVNTSQTAARSAKGLPLDPYTEVRREFSDRFETLKNEKARWMTSTFVSLAIVAALVIYLGEVAKQNKLVPYVVEVDASGLPTNVRAVEAGIRVDERVVKSLLARFVQDVRGVTSDGQVQVQMINRVYSMLAGGSKAVLLMNDYYKADPPAKRAVSTTVTAEVTNLLPLSPDTWQIEWKEVIRNVQGELVSETRWKMSCAVSVTAPDSPKLLQLNPIGVFVTDFNWSQVL